MTDADAYFDSTDPDLKPTAVKLRELVKASSPDFREALKWNVPTYTINSNICAIMVHKRHVNLQIFRGAMLADSEVLSGDGKAMRHLGFRAVADINPALVKRILGQAIDLDSS